jgi:hypothetical protein
MSQLVAMVWRKKPAEIQVSTDGERRAERIDRAPGSRAAMKANARPGSCHESHPSSGKERIEASKPIVRRLGAQYSRKGHARSGPGKVGPPRGGPNPSPRQRELLVAGSRARRVSRVEVGRRVEYG